MGRTLYLAESYEPITVVCDGPSLWVQKKGSAGRRVPLRLIDRVVVVGSVKIDSDILTLLAGWDIPVFFINTKTKETAICLSNKPSNLKYSKRLFIFKASEQNYHRYLDFLRSWRRLIQLSFLERINRNVPAIEEMLNSGFTERHYKSLLRSLVADKAEDFYMTRAVLKGMLFEMIVVKMKRAGIDPEMGILHEGKRFGIVHDICYIFEPVMSFLALKFIHSKKYPAFVRQGKLTPEGTRDLINRFENKAREFSVMINKVLSALSNLIVELEQCGTLRVVETLNER